MVKVNSWNEWGPLKHIIVGRVDGTQVQAEEPAIFRDWPDEGFPRGTHGPLPGELAEAAGAQLDHFAKILVGRGIRVDRPTPLDFSKPVSTPDWVQDTMFGCMPARDLLVVLGNELLEATMSYRSRWFEYLCYRPLIGSYFKQDAEMRWEAAPKPRLTAASYREGFWDEFEALSPEEQVERVRRNDLVLTEEEPLFDAADIARFGKDLFVQLSLVTNRGGIRWLTQHLPEHRVHPVIFGNTRPLHIDATWIPLRPGLVLHCDEQPQTKKCCSTSRRTTGRWSRPRLPGTQSPRRCHRAAAGFLLTRSALTRRRSASRQARLRRSISSTSSASRLSRSRSGR